MIDREDHVGDAHRREEWLDLAARAEAREPESVEARAVVVQESGVVALIRSSYQLLGLRTFFTFNEKEVRAWTIHGGDTASRAAGTIHTDFERGFIKAERVNWKDLADAGSVGRARETGHYSHEGRDYLVQDGDVLLFKFNV